MEQNGTRQPRDPREIQAEIERARAEITSSVLALRERLDAATDWREWFRRRPAILLVAAIGLGLWFGYRRR